MWHIAAKFYLPAQVLNAAPNHVEIVIGRHRTIHANVFRLRLKDR